MMSFLSEKVLSRFSESVSHAIVRSGWLFSDYILRFLIVGITTSLTARYLGPTNFGLLNYAIAFASMIAFFTPLGMQGIQMSRYSKSEHLQSDFSLFFTMKLVASVIATILTLVVSFFIVRDQVVRSMLIALSFGTVFQVYENFEVLFIARNKIQGLVLLKFVPFLLVSLCKVLAVYWRLPLWSFALLQTIEFAGLFVAFALILQKTKLAKLKLSFPVKKVKEVLATTYPMIIVAAAVLIQTRLDQIIIGALVSQEGVGYYSAAYRLAELVNFIPIVIQSAVIGQVLQTFHRDENAFESNMQQLYRIMFVLMVIVCVAVSVVSPLLIQLFFGSAFAPASLILAILVWSKLFTSLRVVKEIFITAKGYYFYLMASFIVGTVVNVLFNALMYHFHLGIYWYAAVSVLTQAVTFLSIDFFFEAMRSHAKLTVRSLMSFWKLGILSHQLEV